jgi:Zn-dependent protease
MLQTLFESPLPALFFVLSLVIAVTVHEFSHALAADRLGDPTPRSQGRLSLNPLVHLDPLGTLSLLLVGFCWGKPVEFYPPNLKSPRRDAAIISLAGPLSNLIVASIFALVGRTLLEPNMASILLPFIYVNVVLAIFNLVPIGPLDGQKILFSLLPRDLAYEYQSIMSRYGTLILLFFILPIFGTTPPIQALIGPVVNLLLRLFLG